MENKLLSLVLDIATAVDEYNKEHITSVDAVDDINDALYRAREFLPNHLWLPLTHNLPTSPASALDPWDLSEADMAIIEKMLDPNDPAGKSTLPPRPMEKASIDLLLPRRNQSNVELFAGLAEGLSWPVGAAAEPRTVTDGCGSTWSKCPRRNCGLEVVRPGKVQCRCDNLEERVRQGLEAVREASSHCPTDIATRLDHLAGALETILETGALLP